MKSTIGTFIILCLCILGSFSVKALAGTITVNNTAESGPGSLRRALPLASDGDVINITAKGTINLTSGELVVDKSLNIRGPGAAKLTISGHGLGRVFHITPNNTVIFSGLRIADGHLGGFRFPGSAGGGVYSDHAQVTLRDCVVSGNIARFGAGIFSNSFGGGNASLTLTNTTISGNSAKFVLDDVVIRGYGGGIFSGGGFLSANPSGDASLTLDHSSVIGNRAAFGGGIFSDGVSGRATTILTNSSITNNAAVWENTVLNDQPSAVGGAGIYEKLQVHSKTEALAKALRENLV